MRYQVWTYRKNKWKVHNFEYSYNHALLAYCKKRIKHGSANVRFYEVVYSVYSERVKRITIESSYGEEVLVADEMRAV